MNTFYSLIRSKCYQRSRAERDKDSSTTTILRWLWWWWWWLHGDGHRQSVFGSKSKQRDRLGPVICNAYKLFLQSRHALQKQNPCDERKSAGDGGGEGGKNWFGIQVLICIIYTKYVRHTVILIGHTNSIGKYVVCISNIERHFLFSSHGEIKIANLVLKIVVIWWSRYIPICMLFLCM